MNFGVVIFPGSNCDVDCFYVLRDVLKVNVDYIWHEDRDISKYDCIFLPGGFSYGDYLRTGAIARFSPVMDEICEFAEKGKLVIGICNGFQILTEAGLLPGALRRNKTLKFICDNVEIIVENNQTPFTRLYEKGKKISLPIAHGEGNYYVDENTLEELKKNNQIVFKYVEDVNGSTDRVAGVCNKKGNVLGMMPHPERASEKILGNSDGLILFKSILDYLLSR